MPKLLPGDTGEIGADVAPAAGLFLEHGRHPRRRLAGGDRPRAGRARIVAQSRLGGEAGGGSSRPDWFWNPTQYGGILCDIGSHQVDQFLFYTGSTEAEVAESQIANVRHPDRPKFQDFGDMVLRGNRGFGYMRLDWFTPNGLGTWGDGRLFILGTDGYIEVRKYTNVTVRPQGNNLYIVDKNQARYIDCDKMPLPFGPQFVADVVNRTHVAQDQTQCLLAAELVVKAQRAAKFITLKD